MIYFLSIKRICIKKIVAENYAKNYYGAKGNKLKGKAAKQGIE